MITVVQGRDTFLTLAVEARRLDQTLRAAVVEVTREYRARLVAELSRPGTGRLYGRAAAIGFRRGRRTVTLFGGVQRRVRTVRRVNLALPAYRASAPGRPPARRTGTLLRSLRTAYPTRDKGFGSRIFADRGLAFYRHFLEFGTAERTVRRPRRSAGRVAPRPVFSPLQQALDREMERRVARAVDLFVAFRGGAA